MMNPPSKSDLRRFKAEAQRLKATVKLGKHGLSPQFLESLATAFKHHTLVKVKFDEHKEERRELAAQMAEASGSYLVTMVGHVAVLYRPKAPEPAAPA